MSGASEDKARKSVSPSAGTDGAADANTSRKAFLWNSAGSAIYALSSFLLLVIVVRLCGDEEGGVFSIGYAIAQLMLTLGAFELIVYFATDAANRFSFEQYLGFKLLSCLAMAVGSVLYTLSFGFDAHGTLVALSLCLYRFFEALAQYWFAAFQKLGHLDKGGFSTAVRSLLAIVVFAALLFFTRDLAVSMLAASASEAVWIAAYDVPQLNALRALGRPDFSLGAMRGLFLACLPLFIASFLSIYLGNVCKYAIEDVGTNQMQTVFNILFMPSFVINLFVNFFIRPSLTGMATAWLEGRARQFARTIARLLCAVAVITVVVLVGCVLLGIPVLEAFYGTDLEGALPSLLILVVGGGCLSAANVFYNALVTIRAQVGVVVGYVVAIGVATLAATPLVRALGVEGASIAYALSGVVLIAGFVAMFLFCSWRSLVKMRGNDGPGRGLDRER